MYRLSIAILIFASTAGSKPANALQFDAETGLVRMGVRDYDPVIGRFLEEDPEYHPSQNTYAYALNNPLLYVDPMGTDVILVREGFRDFYHQVVYIDDPENPGKFVKFEFGPAEQNAGLLLPFNVQGHPYSNSFADTIKGDILKRLPQNPNEDAWSIQEARMFLRSGRWSKYNLYRNNCTDFAGALYKHLSSIPAIGPSR